MIINFIHNDFFYLQFHPSLVGTFLARQCRTRTQSQDQPKHQTKGKKMFQIKKLFHDNCSLCQKWLVSYLFSLKTQKIKEKFKFSGKSLRSIPGQHRLLNRNFVFTLTGNQVTPLKITTCLKRPS